MPSKRERQSLETSVAKAPKETLRIIKLPSLRPLLHKFDRKLPEFSPKVEYTDQVRARTPLPAGKPSKTKSTKETSGNERHTEISTRRDVILPVLNARYQQRRGESAQIPARTVFLGDSGVKSRIRLQKRFQEPGKRHNRPDGFTAGHILPPADSIGRQDELGRPVPTLTLTTPTEAGKAWTGETSYLRDSNQWPEPPQHGGRWSWPSSHNNGVVSRRDYERRGAELEEKRYRDAYKRDPIAFY